nr:MAG TPA: hypothetical protein [Caudoviricetes sp.]
MKTGEMKMVKKGCFRYAVGCPVPTSSSISIIAG